MNISFRSSSKGNNNKSKILDLINFNNLLSDNDILQYDDENSDISNEDYDYVIYGDKLDFEDDLYKDDTIYYL